MGEINWITSGELKDHYIGDTKEKITEESAIANNLKLLPRGTFVIAIYGLEAEGVRATGSITTKKSTISQACMAFIPKGRISNEFLYSWYKRHGNSIGIKYAQGTKQQNLSYEIIERLKIHFPSHQEQEKISAFIKLLDARIDIQNKVIERYQSLIRAITQTCFQGKYEYSQIPLSEIAPNIASGKSKPTAGKYPLYGSTGIIGTCSSGAYKGEMVLVARVGSIGQVQLINTSGCGITDNTLIIDSGELNRYVYFFLKTFDFHKITSGTTQPLITGGSLKRISVPILPATKRGLFISLLSAIEQRKKIEQELLQYYLQSKSYVLANMFI